MKTERALHARSASTCELCRVTEDLQVFPVPPASSAEADDCVLLCCRCREQIEGREAMDVNYWRCLNDSMWSQVPAVQVMAWRMLMRLRAEGWPQDLLDMLYLDDTTRTWAAAIGEGAADTAPDTVVHLDSNGA